MSPAAAAADGGERRRPPLGVREGRGRTRGCGGPAGAAALGLALLGLALYLVPAAAALAWLAVGASAAWWGLSREPRGPRGLSSFVRESRRHPRPALTASPLPAKSPVNGSLCEPRSPLGGPDPAELLLMGSYLGKPGPPEPALPQDPRDRPGRRPPSRSPPSSSTAQRVHHVYPALPTPLLRPSRRPPHRDCGPLSSRFVITPRRRYPIQQAQYSLLGALPTVCWNGGHKKAVLSARNSRMVCSPVTVRIAPPDSKLFRSPMPEQILSTTLSSPSSNAPDPCAKETVLNALKEKKKRTVAEEDQLHLDGQENKRRRHDSSGSGHSAFEPLVANGVPAAFVPKPGSLKRSLASQSSDDHLNKRSRTSSVSSLTSTCTGGIPSSSRNAITSSYSSTRGVSQLWKRSGPTSSPFSSPASSRSQTPERPAKKTREEEPCHQSSSSAPLVTDKESPGEKVTDPATGKQQSLWTSPPTPGSSGQRKRKIQLLPSRRGDQLTLPPPPELGYSITAEDLDMERRASLQWFNKVLEDKTDDASTPATDTSPATSPPFTLTLPTVGPAASPASLPAPSSNPLLESLKKMQESPAPSSSEPPEAATVAAPSPPKTPSLLAPLVSPLTGPLASTSSDSKPTTTFLGLASASSATPLTDTKAPGVSQAQLCVSTPAATAPSPTPASTLFGMLSPPASSSSLATPGPACASPMFKPIFPATPKSESDNPLPTSSSAATTTPASTALPTTATATAHTFKPIFESVEPFAAMPLSPPFSLKQTTAPATTAATSAPLLTGLGTATSTVATGTTASASKPVFGFGVTTAASTASTIASTSQSLLFGGAPPVTASSSAPALASIFQFGKPLAPAASVAGTSFSQSLASSAQTAASNSSGGFSGFGGTLTTSTSAPATTSQPTLTFSNTVTPTFNIPFSASAKPALPTYPGANSQPTFGATDGATKPALAPSFGSSFTFGNSVASAPSAAPAPAAFGGAAQPAFGGLKASASTFGTPASTQPAFGSTTSVFSFGSATTSGFGAAAATTQTTHSGSSSSLFGSSTPSPFTFGGSAAPAGGGGFGLSATPGTGSTSGTFSFGSGQSGTTGTTTSFGGSLSQNTLGAPSQSSPFAFSVGSTPESKPVFGGTSTPTFGQSAPAPGVGTTGSSLSFGAPSTPAQGFVGVGPFGSGAPSFSIGAGSKTPGARQRLQARRQHTRKK
ncbi:nuclear pore membrane glycoprotein 121 [Rattus norvegicus]|uniref:POM121 transmembrane nucleoporin n=2 Tax=Rattus norvegicus TaxID=10116 RepID=G3V659_RAT|nr:nuclear envelope pore membrane protein POM 121 [Rattus norvegicus]EDM13370.1 nuclear pore membrane glycoprotein 121 [Rattus norvegicus]